MSDETVNGLSINGNGNAVGNHNNITVNNYASASPVVSSPHQLPSPPADFTGREKELEELRAAMTKGGAAISGLAGMGGVGKTALALKLAHELKPQYPDADLYLDLKGIEAEPVSVSAALQHFIRAFHPQAPLPDDVVQLAAIYRSTLSSQRAIVLLDNAKDAAQVASLKPPLDCATIVTSRRYFNLAGLVPLRLDTLKPQESHTFLLEISSRIGDYAPEMARVLDYLPLALRLAASALNQRPDLTPEEYLRRLNDAKTRLNLTDDTLLEGPRSIEASLQLSYDLFSPSLQADWRTLAVFPDSFDKTAVAAVWETELDNAADQLADLYNFSMVDFDTGTKRYRLHDLARDFAALRLSDGEKHTAASRHAMHYLAVLSGADDLFLQSHDGVLRGLKRFDRERINILAGQAWSASHVLESSVAAHLCMLYPNGGIHVLHLRQSPHEQIAWLNPSLAAARQLKRRDAEGVVLGNLGTAYGDLGEPRRAMEYCEQALVIAHETSDRKGEANGLGSLGTIYGDLGEPRRAIEYYEQALTIYREICDRRGEGNTLGGLGTACRKLGEPRRALEYYGQALVIAREIGDRRGEANANGGVGNALINLGEPHRALEYYEPQLQIAREIGDRWGESNALGGLGNVYANLGKLNSAIEYFEQTLVISHEIGDRRSRGITLGNLGTAYGRLGEAHRALEYFEQYLAIAHEIDDRWGEASVLWQMSMELIKSGDRNAALQFATQALHIFEQIESPLTAMVREALAELQSEPA